MTTATHREFANVSTQVQSSDFNATHVPEKTAEFIPLTVEILTDNAVFHHFLKEDPNDTASSANLRSNLWLTAKWSSYVAFAILAIASAVLSGIYLPIYLPLVTLSVLSLLPLIHKAYEHCEDKQLIAQRIGEQEVGIAAKVKELEDASASGTIDINAKVKEIKNGLNIELSFHDKDKNPANAPVLEGKDRGNLLLLARYLYWKDEEKKYLADGANHCIKALSLRSQSPDKTQANGGAAKLAGDLEKELIDMYETVFRASIAKTQAAFARHLMNNPYHQGDITDSCDFHHCPQQIYNSNAYLKEKGWAKAVRLPVEVVHFREDTSCDLVRSLTGIMFSTIAPKLEMLSTVNDEIRKGELEKLAQEMVDVEEPDTFLAHRFAYLESTQKHEVINRGILSIFKAVGDLHDKFTFPSIHLPIALTVNGRTVVSWDLTDNATIDSINADDAYGLKGSTAAALHTNGNREENILERILAMLHKAPELEDTTGLTDDTRKAALERNRKLKNEYDDKQLPLIVLQNCTESLAIDIQNKAPGNLYSIHKVGDNQVIVANDKFEIKDALAGMPQEHLVLEDRQIDRKYIVVPVKMAYTEDNEIAKKFAADYIAFQAKAADKGYTLLMVGNTGHPPHAINKALTDAAQKADKVLTPFDYAPYATTIQKEKKDKQERYSLNTSQIYVAGPEANDIRHPSLNSVMPDLEEAVTLLSRK